MIISCTEGALYKYKGQYGWELVIHVTAERARRPCPILSYSAEAIFMYEWGYRLRMGLRSSTPLVLHAGHHEVLTGDKSARLLLEMTTKVIAF